MAPKPTTVDLKTLKDALGELKALQTAMGQGGSGAYGRLTDATDVTHHFGPLIDNSGTQISTYINARANAVREAIHLSGRGVSAAISMLQSTIDNYDKHEHGAKTSADSTGKGGTPASNPGKG